MATQTLTIHDQTLTGQSAGEGFTLSLDELAETITARELIRARVYQEVDDHNRRVRAGDAAGRPYNGLVTPAAAEQQLNGPRQGKVLAREIDWRKQFETACDAFARSGFLILVDDRQVGDLDEPITLRPTTDVAFVKLTMLVGG